jgi:hypothetical protein
LLACTIDRSQLSIEEKYQILMENYEELEAELLRVSLGLTRYTPNPWVEISNARMRFNRRVLNYLSSARMYLDQVPSELENASRDPQPVVRSFEESQSHHYDSKLSYRVCEALRNYTQHRDLPVHGFEYGWRREPDDPPKAVVSYTGLKLDLSRLESDVAFKGTTLAELRSLGDTYDLKLFLREYMNSLGDIHISLRKDLSADSEWAMKEIVQARTKAHSMPDAQSGYDMALLMIQEDGQSDTTAALVISRGERRKLLQDRSARPPAMVKIQLSSE